MLPDLMKQKSEAVNASDFFFLFNIAYIGASAEFNPLAPEIAPPTKRTSR